MASLRDHIRSAYAVCRDFTERTLLAWQQQRSSGRPSPPVTMHCPKHAVQAAPFGKPGTGVCAGCGDRWDTGNLKVCSACKGQPGEPLYCSQPCQRKDWRRHKPGCQATRSKR